MQNRVAEALELLDEIGLLALRARDDDPHRHQALVRRLTTLRRFARRGRSVQAFAPGMCTPIPYGLPAEGFETPH